MCSLWRVGRGGGSERAHNPKVAGSNPAPATIENEGLADVEAANPFRLPRLHPGMGSAWRPTPHRPGPPAGGALADVGAEDTRRIELPHSAASPLVRAEFLASRASP